MTERETTTRAIWHPTDTIGVAALLPWRMLAGTRDDGDRKQSIVALRDGGLLVGWRFAGRHREIVSDIELDEMAIQWEELLRSLRSGWQITVDCVRRIDDRYPTSARPISPSIGLLHAERRAYFTQVPHYQSETVITLSYHPRSREISEYVAQLLAGNHSQAHRSLYERHLDDLDVTARRIAQYLRSIGSLVPLGPVLTTATAGATPTTVLCDELLQYLYYCVSGVWQLVAPPAPGIPLAKAFADADRSFGDPSQIDDLQMRVIRCVSLPDQVRPGDLSGLLSLPMVGRFAQRIIPLGESQSKALLAQAQRRLSLGRLNLFRLVRDSIITKNAQSSDNVLVEQQQRDLALVEQYYEQQRVGFTHVTWSVILYGSSQEIDLMTRASVDALRSCGIVARPVASNARLWWQASLPGEHVAGLSQYAPTSLYAAATFPYTSLWMGVSEHPSNLYPRDAPAHLLVESPSRSKLTLPLHWSSAGHTLVLGAQRSGKSVLLKELLAAHLTMPSLSGVPPRAVVLDKDYAMRTLLSALATEGVASYIAQAEVTFSPLRWLPRVFLTDEDRRLLEETASFIEYLYATYPGSERERTITKEIREDIEQALRQIARRPQRTLAELARVVSHPRLREVITYYTSPTRRIGQILNGSSDILERTPPVIGIEMSALLSGFQAPHDILPVYRYLLWIIMRLSSEGAPMGVWLDEASVYTRNTMLGEYLVEVLKQFGKRNCFAVIATQSAIDVLGDEHTSALGDAIIQECKTKIYAPDASARIETTARALRRLGDLSEREIAHIATMGRSLDRCYYYCSPLGKATFTLRLAQRPVAAAYYTRDEGEYRQRTERLIAQHPRTWIPRFLKDAGVSAQWIAEYTTRAQRYGQFGTSEVA